MKTENYLNCYKEMQTNFTSNVASKCPTRRIFSLAQLCAHRLCAYSSLGHIPLPNLECIVFDVAGNRARCPQESFIYIRYILFSIQYLYALSTCPMQPLALMVATVRVLRTGTAMLYYIHIIALSLLTVFRM